MVCGRFTGTGCACLILKTKGLCLHSDEFVSGFFIKSQFWDLLTALNGLNLKKEKV
tara:strand:- start:328 stop:495 length:168 start_codon:yes stop_codon:yes gene_type:complete